MVAEARLTDVFRIHGWCDRVQLQSVIHSAHIGIVPTHSNLGEGFNQACVEFLLSGRPAVVSSSVAAAEYVANAVTLVPVDDPLTYAEVLSSLSKNFAKLESMHKSCAHLIEKFLDPQTSYQAAMEHVLHAISLRKDVADRRIGTDGSVRH